MRRRLRAAFEVACIVAADLTAALGYELRWLERHIRGRDGA